MCGLVGAIVQNNVTPVLVDALQRLEYRGYDSAGIAVLDARRRINVRRRVGKVYELRQSLHHADLDSPLGIAHTRWATHGKPAVRNAHPLMSGNEVAVVHNGIIENYEPLKLRLQADGYRFQSDTDTEVIAHLIHQRMSQGQRLIEAVREITGELQGAYAIAVLAVAAPETLVVARSGSPLVIGVSEDAQYVASDVTALLPVTRRFIFLEEGDVAELRLGSVNIIDRDGQPAIRPLRDLRAPGESADRGNYRHFMLKEIHEQPDALAATLRGRIVGDRLDAEQLGFRATPGLLDRVRCVHIVACGTSSHAGQVARYWIESMAGLPCNVELASEYRYRSPVVPEGCLFIGISQSGETADTLAALRFAKQSGYLVTLAICNAPESSIPREADLCLMTQAGPEMGVASTKAFTTQLLSLLMITGLLTRHSGRAATESQIVAELGTAAAAVDAVLSCESAIADLAATIALHPNALFLGRGVMYPIALEGALKLKEISYVHAEGYAAGELKHGPLALVDASMPVIAVAPRNGWLEKVKSNLQEVSARGGHLFIFADRSIGLNASDGVSIIEMPDPEPLVAPIAYSVALQLLAYHTAVIKGTDVDRPRNLAKSVTVE